MNQGNEQMNDRAFDNYLQGDSALSRAYAELPEIKLPDHLDAAILAEAHRAVGAAPGGRKKYHWNFPLSMVATLFVVVMAGLILPDMLKDVAVTHDLQQSQPASLPETAPAEVAAPVVATPMVADRLAKKVQEPLPLKAEIAVTKPIAETVRLPEKEVAVDKPVAARMAPSAAPAAPAAQMLGAAAERMQAAEQMENAERKAASKEKRAVMAVERSKLEAAAPAATMAASSALLDEAAAESPQAEAWLQRIKKLQQEGKQEEAKKELAAFRKKYPDYVIPKELSLP